MPGSSGLQANLSIGMLWHGKLGHPGIPAMSDMARRGDIPRLNQEELTEVRDCEICCMGKMGQKGHAMASDDVATMPKMGRLHLDLIGPFGVKSMHGGFDYAQTGIEVNTRLSTVSLLRHKSEALSQTRITVQKLEVESGLALKSIRTDGGGEYTSKEWRGYCEDKGIRHELTAPYSPQQNGMCERLNRTLMEKMRCLLMWSKLPKSYWDVALMHANWLRNRTPTSSLTGGIPIEEWTGRQIKMDRSHTFGCLVQYLLVGHDKNKQGDKYAARTAFGVYIGLAADQAGYNIFDPLRAGVMVRTDVRFFEEVPGYPRLMGGRAPQVEAKADEHFLQLFPDTDDEPKAGGVTGQAAATVPQTSR